MLERTVHGTLEALSTDGRTCLLCPHPVAMQRIAALRQFVAFECVCFICQLFLASSCRIPSNIPGTAHGQNNHNLEVIWPAEQKTPGLVLYVRDRSAVAQAVHHMKNGLQCRCR